MTHPSCIFCEIGSVKHPCRAAGRFNIEILADSYTNYTRHVVKGLSPQTTDIWSDACCMNLVETEPLLSFELVLLCLDRLDTSLELSFLAAGPLEDLIQKHGSRVIENVEKMAHVSPRFRFLLSGVWSQGKDDTDTWRRVIKARAQGPHMDLDVDVPLN